MNSRARQFLLILWGALALSGCSVTGGTANPAQAIPMSTMKGLDITMGKLTRSAPEDLVIVLMAQANHRQLTRDQSVRWSDDLPPRYAQFIADLSQRHALTRVADWPLDSIGIQCLVFRVRPGGSRESVLAALRNQPGIEDVQPLNYFTTLGEPAYDDPYLPMQHNLDTLGILEAHRWATGLGVRVAVIDTGLDNRHADLDHAIELRRNFVDRNQIAFRADRHGTAVAGVIAANRNNGTGMVGIAPDARMLALKSCWQNGDESARCSSFTLAKALDFAILQRVDVINLSLGGPRDALLERLVKRAIANDISVVGATHPVIENAFPVAIPSVISVGVSEQQQLPRSTLRAPGHKILATAPGGNYEFASGSSFSAAQVSGLIALLRQRKPHMAPALIKHLLFRTAANGAVNSCRMLASTIGGQECSKASPITQQSNP